MELEEEQSQLLNACLKGHRSAQKRLYELFARKMMGTCLWYARNREEAEEILQDGFMRVFTYLKGYKGEGSLEGWIKKIMINIALTRYRNKTKSMHVVELNPDRHERTDDFINYGRYDEQLLLKLVQTLSPRYRMVFNLYVFEGMKHREIAELLHISEGTSKSNLSEARIILQRALLEKTRRASK
jgi:RNA polymerase sigma factor (sigma-70 family)